MGWGMVSSSYGFGRGIVVKGTPRLRGKGSWH